MSWRRGLFRLWIVGAALFVIAVAYSSYSDIKEEFDKAAEVQATSTCWPMASWWAASSRRTGPR
jgi:hypothetical protein